MFLFAQHAWLPVLHPGILTFSSFHNHTSGKSSLFFLYSQVHVFGPEIIELFYSGSTPDQVCYDIGKNWYILHRVLIQRLYSPLYLRFHSFGLNKIPLASPREISWQLNFPCFVMSSKGAIVLKHSNQVFVWMIKARAKCATSSPFINRWQKSYQFPKQVINIARGTTDPGYWVSHVLVHFVKSFGVYNVKSSSTLFSDNI